MNYILNIETSTKVCSVAIHENGKLLALKEGFDANSHSAVLLPFIEDVLEEAGISKSQLTAIGISKGPGSYTGLRIGVASAKGLAYALDIPIISVDSLQLITRHMVSKLDNSAGEPTLFCPMIDARRMEVYCCIHDTSVNTIDPIKAEIIDNSSFLNFLESNTVYFGGDGSQKCKDAISSDNAKFIDDVYPSAEFMGKIINTKFLKNDMEDLAYFEPYYLKEFVTNTPKKNLLL